MAKNLSNTTKNIINILIIALMTIILNVLAYHTNFDLITKWALAIIIILLLSRVIIKVNKFRQMFYFAYLLGGKSGLNFIDSLSRVNQRFWIAMADWGLVISFGLLSYLLFKEQLNKRTILVGIISIFGILYLILPYSALAFNFINIPQVTNQLNSPQVQQSSPFALIGFVAVNILLLIGGFALFVIVTIVYSALNILYGIFIFLGSVANNAPNYSIINSQIPGVAPIIPGITTPLFAGIVAIAILLIVNEFSHGVLARIANVKLKEIGVLLVGAFPIGAYVEPDEKQIKGLGKDKQNRIMVAGVASNMLFAIITFVLLIAIINYVLPSVISTKVIISALVPNSPAASVIPAGSQILMWNSYKVTNASSFVGAAKSNQPNSIVNVVTDKGTFTVQSNATGKIGIFITQQSAPKNGDIPGNAVYFVYVVLALSFLLNFLIGVVNLLPVPGLDGWQIYKLKMKNKKLLLALAYITVISVLVSALPWLYTH